MSSQKVFRLRVLHRKLTFKEAEVVGRTLKRVPLDFDYPLKQVWYGYLLRPSTCMSGVKEEYCDSCKKFAEIKGIPISYYGCPEFDDITDAFMKQFDPPEGEGYQLWGTTTEGEPRSPVFKTLEELCAWCAENDTVFADIKATKEQWKEMLDTDFVHAKVGNSVFI